MTMMNFLLKNKLMDEAGADGAASGSFDVTSIASTEFTDEQIESFGFSDEQKTLFSNRGDDGILVTDDVDFQFTDEQIAKFTEIVKGGDEEDSSTGAPESYENFTLPEGMEMDKVLLEKISPIFKGVNLTQENAQSIITGYSEYLVSQEAARQKDYDDKVAGWGEQVKADKELGGDNYNETVRLSSEALNQLGTPELKQFFDEYGIGNHPEIVKFCMKVGKLVAEDSPAGGGTPPSEGEKSQSEIMYPDAATG